MLVRRSIYAMVAAAVAVMTVAGPGAAQDGAPDPAIAQYVETMPTSGGASARDARTEQTSAENSQPAAGATSSTELIGLGGALVVLSAGAVGFAAVRGRRNRT